MKVRGILLERGREREWRSERMKVRGILWERGR